MKKIRTASFILLLILIVFCALLGFGAFDSYLIKQFAPDYFSNGVYFELSSERWEYFLFNHKNAISCIIMAIGLVQYIIIDLIYSHKQKGR